jgi:hypothetical protein
MATNKYIKCVNVNGGCVCGSDGFYGKIVLHQIVDREWFAACPIKSWSAKPNRQIYG